MSQVRISDCPITNCLGNTSTKVIRGKTPSLLESQATLKTIYKLGGG